MPNLILCVDDCSLEYAGELAKETRDLVFGFRLNRSIFHYGSKLIYQLRNYGHVLADVKSLDQGNYVLKSLVTAGASLVSIIPHYPFSSEFKQAAVGTIFENLCGINLSSEQIKISEEQDFQHVILDAAHSEVVQSNIPKIIRNVIPNWMEPFGFKPNINEFKNCEHLIVKLPYLAATSCDLVSAIRKTKEEIANFS